MGMGESEGAAYLSIWEYTVAQAWATLTIKEEEKMRRKVPTILSNW